MADIKLSKLPDRKQVKITLTLPPELHQALREYAAVYAEIYGSEEPVSALIPPMLAAFLENDRAFARLRGRP